MQNCCWPGTPPSLGLCPPRPPCPGRLSARERLQPDFCHSPSEAAFVSAHPRCFVKKWLRPSLSLRAASARARAAAGPAPSAHRRPSAAAASWRQRRRGLLRGGLRTASAAGPFRRGALLSPRAGRRSLPKAARPQRRPPAAMKLVRWADGGGLPAAGREPARPAALGAAAVARHPVPLGGGGEPTRIRLEGPSRGVNES